MATDSERISAKPPLSPPGRAQRAGALVLDLGFLGAAIGFGIMVALAWLLIRTDRGRVDPGDGESIIAAAVVASAVPAWFAWLLLRLVTDAATPGQHAQRLAVYSRGPRALSGALPRLIVHPVAAPFWLWLAFLAWIATLSPVAALFTAIAVTIVGMGAASAVLVMREPGALALHDYIAGTRIQRSSPRRASADSEETAP